MAINDPSLEKLKDKNASAYTLVAAVSKRTRELVDGAQPLVDPTGKKSIGIAIDEIDSGMITIHRKLDVES
jgi:DNA-directed RNA polymerase subunit omega